ncbi:hypothetical protein GCM10011349_11590 [Novosphingobium indicum]|uniref:Transposase n=1 Tax=Novosphingobium indicum TaxID=462949 RepID=A0ABQ2JDS4_9SPHN|nr:hypothetical protein GCM10011349_11590 [Novosphingobium indicum]
MQGRADPGFAAPSLKLGRNDARVVEHQHVPLPEQHREIPHVTIRERRASFDYKHARGIARPRRTQGDPLLRKVEIEEVYTHGGAR